MVGPTVQNASSTQRYLAYPRSMAGVMFLAMDESVQQLASEDITLLASAYMTAGNMQSP